MTFTDLEGITWQMPSTSLIAVCSDSIPAATSTMTRYWAVIGSHWVTIDAPTYQQLLPYAS